MGRKKNPSKQPQASGGARLVAAGKKTIPVVVDAAEHELIRQAAAKDERSMAAFARRVVIDAARRAVE